MPLYSAKKTLPKVSTKPTSSEATSAPVIEPMPPITTTTKQMISTLAPMPGYTDDMGAAIMPASAASATPPANTMRYSRVMSMPSPRAMSRLLAPARIIMPRRVRLTTQYRPQATSTQAAEANSRYHGYDISSPSAKLPPSHAGIGTPCTSLPTRMARVSSNTRMS